MMYQFRKLIGDVAHVNVCCKEPRDTKDGDSAMIREDNRRGAPLYKVIFTSGASEVNSSVVHAAYSTWVARHETVPCFVTSAIEHKSLLLTIDQYVRAGFATVAFVQPDEGGHISPVAVARALTPDTCLVCVMHANNETGAINDVGHIASMCRARGIPFHCDTVQTFGKLPVVAADSMCVSFHKLYGPPGVGAWILRDGLGFEAVINGTQNEGMRGGTENIPGLGASLTALRETIVNRAAKNREMCSLKRRMLNQLSARFRVRTYEDYMRVPGSAPLEIIVVGGCGTDYLPGTALISIKCLTTKVCNASIRGALQKQGIVVSIGSACNTASPQASHILYAMGADEYIRRGTLRISLGDGNTKKDVDTFVGALIAIITRSCPGA
jgi:cysteine desulfurase